VPDLYTIAPDDYDPRDVVDEPEPEPDEDATCECCGGTCPPDQIVCDDCERLIEEMETQP